MLFPRYGKRRDGGIELGEAVIRTLETKESHYHQLYSYDASIDEKIETIAKKIYGRDGVSYSRRASQKKRLEELGFSNLPICMAKNQYSLSDDPKKLGRPEGFDITIVKFTSMPALAF